MQLTAQIENTRIFSFLLNSKAQNVRSNNPNKLPSEFYVFFTQKKWTQRNLHKVKEKQNYANNTKSNEIKDLKHTAH